MHKTNDTKKYSVFIEKEFSPKSYKEWNDVWINTPDAPIASSPDWFDAACKSHDYKEFVIVQIRAVVDNRLCVVLPLVRSTLFNFDAYISPASEFAPHLAMLCTEKNREIESLLVETLNNLGTVVLSGVLEWFKNDITCLSSKQSIFISDKEYFLDFTKGKYGEFSKRKLRKLMKKVNDSHDHLQVKTFNTVTPELLKICYEIDLESSKHKKGKGVFWNSIAASFYDNLAKSMPNSLFLTLLYCNNKAIAYHIHFFRNSTYIGSQKAYLATYEFYNPGFYTFLKFIDSVRSDDSVAVSFGKGEDKYKKFFSKSYQSLYTIVFSNKRFNRSILANLLLLRQKLYLEVNTHQVLYSTYKFMYRLLR